MLPAFPFTFLPTASHPFARRAGLAPRQGPRAASPRYSEATLVRLSALLGASEKMLQTDFCNRHLARAPTTTARSPSPQLAPRDHAAPSRSRPPACAVDRDPVPPRDAAPPFGNPAPAGTRLTARLQLRSSRSLRCLPLTRRAPWGSLFESHLAVAFSATHDVGVRPLTLPVAPRSPDVSAERREEPGSLSPTPRQRSRVPRSEAPFIVRLSSRDRFRSSRFTKTRHRCRGFATANPASGAFSFPLALAIRN